MNREKILLIAVVVILGLLAYSRFSGGEQYRMPPSAAMPVELPASAAQQAVVGLEGVRERDPLLEPKEERPLAPLVLPLPPVDDFAAVMPPPVPDSGPSQWSAHLLRVAAALPGSLDDLIEESSTSDDLAEFTAQGGADDEADYNQSYDFVRVNTLTVFWGRLLGEERYDKQKGDPISFQEVDPRTGRERFAARDFAADEYESFGFAKTLRNDIELRIRALSPSPAALDERMQLVTWLLSQGPNEPVAFEYAVQIAQEGTELSPDYLEAWLSLGEAWERTFHLDEAFALYARMIGQPLPGAPPAAAAKLADGRFSEYSLPYVRLAGVLQRLGVNDEARRLLERGAALGDGSPSALIALGASYLAGGDPAAAQPLLERAQGMHGSHTDPLALRNAQVRGECLLALGEWSEAERVFTEAHRGALDPVYAAPLMAGRVAARYLGGQFEDAASLAAEAVETYGALTDLLYMRGITGAAAGAPAGEVVRDLRGAAEAAGLDAALPLAALAFWYRAQGASDESAQALGDALELDPDLDYALYLRARWSARDGDTQGSREDLRELVGRWPHFAAALVELGWLLHGDGLYEAAEVALRRASEDAPQWADASLRRGFNQLRLDDLEGARESLATAQGLATERHEIRNALAWAFNAEGDLAAAIAEFSFAQDVLRDDEESAQFQYAKAWQTRLALHERKRLWVDSFEGRLLRPGWISDARSGVEPRVLDGALRIAGTHRDANRTRVSREIPAMSFISFAGDLRVADVHRGDAGLQLSLERGGRSTWEFRLYRDREGRLQWYVKQGSRETRGEGGFLGTGTAMRLEAVLDREQAPPILTVTAGGNVVYQEAVPALRAASMPMRIGIYAETSNALPVAVALDNVELVFLSNQ